MKKTLNLLTTKEIWIINYLKSNYEADFPITGAWTSPTQIGRDYGLFALGKEGHHSSTASPTCKRLVEKGILERNNTGHYRLKK